jgi:hypothetical protein
MKRQMQMDHLKEVIARGGTYSNVSVQRKMKEQQLEKLQVGRRHCPEALLGAWCSVLVKACQWGTVVQSGEGMGSLPHGVLGRQEEAAAEAQGLAALQVWHKDTIVLLSILMPPWPRCRRTRSSRSPCRQAGHRRARAPLPRVPLPLTRGCSLVETAMK